MERSDNLARYPVFRCNTCGTAIAEFALPSFSASKWRAGGDPRDPPVVNETSSSNHTPAVTPDVPGTLPV